MPPARNTFAVGTLEVGGLTGVLVWVGATIWFILSSGTIIISITSPSLWDTATTGASKGIGGTLTAEAFHFIRVVPTIIVLVTYPHLGDAFTILTLERIWITGGCRTFLLVLSIGTVCFAVATSASWDAVA